MNRQILVFVCALTLATRVQIGAIDLNRPLHEHDYEQEQEYGKMQKYTCPMHPEVITDHPGNCPKCGMKLVPIKEKKRRTPNVQRSTSNIEHSSPAVAGTSNIVQPETHSSHMSHPSDATPHGEMEMSMHST